MGINLFGATWESEKGVGQRGDVMELGVGHRGEVRDGVNGGEGWG